MSNIPITKFGGVYTNSSTIIEPPAFKRPELVTNDYDLAIDGNKGRKCTRVINSVNGRTYYVNLWSSSVKSPLGLNGKYYTIEDAETVVNTSSLGTTDPAIGTDTQAHKYFRSTQVI